MSFNQVNLSFQTTQFESSATIYELGDAEQRDVEMVIDSPILAPLCEPDFLEDGFVLSIPVEKK